MGEKGTDAARYFVLYLEAILEAQKKRQGREKKKRRGMRSEFCLLPSQASTTPTTKREGATDQTKEGKERRDALAEDLQLPCLF